MPENLFSRRSMAKLAVEGVVVVVSILIAFALDAWWAERQTNRETLEDLAIVEGELAENVRLARLTIEIMEKVVAANHVLLEEFAAQPDSALIEVDVTTFFWAVFINPTFDPSFGATDAWIAAGRLGALERPELRQRLASVRGKVEDVYEEQDIAREIAIHRIYPHLEGQIGDIASLQQLFSDGFAARPSTSVQVVPGSGSLSVPNSNALRFLLRVRSVWFEASIYETRDFQTEIEAIQLLLEDETRRRSSARRDSLEPRAAE